MTISPFHSFGFDAIAHVWGLVIAAVLAARGMKRQELWIAIPGSQSDLMGATKLLRASVSPSTRVLLRINMA